MPVRKVITARQQTAAQLLIDGEPAYRALKRAGYSHWTARKFGFLLRRCWGLREALRLELERRQYFLRPAPKRKRYDRRAAGIAIMNYCVAEDRQAISNIPTHRLYLEERRVERIAAGLPPAPERPVERFTAFNARCQDCGRLVSSNALVLDVSQTRYVCGPCAGA